MPSSNGVYSLPSGYLAVTGATIQASQHNPPLEDIAAALTGRLSRDGTAAMTGPFQAAPGTVGAPGIVSSSDLTSGFYKTASGIGVAVGGVKVAEFLAGGVVGSRYVGELIPFTGTAAPSLLTVLPFGQTLSRTGQPQLWAFAQTEIAAGNTFYNNGDGSLTFGIGDLRGRVPAAWDKIGGTAANRLTTAGSGVNGSILGTAGGLENQTLTQAQLSVALGTATTNIINGAGLPAGAANTTAGNAGSPVNVLTNATAFVNVTASTTITNSLGGNPHPNVQPTLVCNYLLFAGA